MGIERKVSLLSVTFRGKKKLWTLIRSDGKEEKTETINLCKLYFPLFYKDFDILIKKEIIKQIDFDKYEWTKSKTSLAEYFKWISPEKNNIPCGFWAFIETTFTIKGNSIKRGSLTKLAGNNANQFKPEESKDFKTIKNLLLQYRKDIKQQEEERAKLQKDFKVIKELLKDFENGNIEILQRTKEKIKNILTA